MRSTCAPGEGQSAPSGDSFSDSPDPTPRYGRPGYIDSSVAHAWAIRTGWYRGPGGVTAVPSGTRSVACAAASDAGRETGEIVLQVQFSWAPEEDAALEGARVWKGAQPDEFFTDDWHDPPAMYSRGEEKVSDDELREALMIGPDPELHVSRIREIEELGATTVALMNVSGADPRGAIAFYRDSVLPELRG